MLLAASPVGDLFMLLIVSWFTQLRAIEKAKKAKKSEKYKKIKMVLTKFKGIKSDTRRLLTSLKISRVTA